VKARCHAVEVSVVTYIPDVPNGHFVTEILTVHNYIAHAVKDRTDARVPAAKRNRNITRASTYLFWAFEVLICSIVTRQVTHFTHLQDC